MSKNLSKNKKIKSTFTAKQPGYINVAGETFFLSDDDTVFSAALVDDSLKGELAFQELFLKPFTPEEQSTLRRIYSTIFGSSSILGRKGLALPCEEQEIDLLVKSLIYRRDKLIQQIQSYRILLSNDIHARHMRDQLLKLNTLIDDEIPNSLAPCKDTDLDLEVTGKLSGLTNERMLKLLEIFAFLLAQGKDPLLALRDSNPSPIEILPKMAKREAKKLRDYEAEFEKVNPGEVPQYTETLKKIRRILMDKSAEPATDKELLSVINDIEKDLGIEDSSGSAADRKARILQVLRGLKQSMIEEGNCKRTLASITAERDRLKALVEDCEKKLKEPGAEIQRLKQEITDLQDNLNVAKDELNKLQKMYEKGQFDNKALQDEITRINALLVELKALQAEVAKLRPLKGKADITKEALALLNQQLEELGKRANITPAELDALQVELGQLRPLKGRADIPQQDIDALKAEITELKKRGEITPEDLVRLRAEVARLLPFGDRGNITQEALDALRAEVAELKKRGEITPEDLATLRAQVERLIPFEGRANITEADLDALRAELDLLRPLKGRGDITVDDLLRLRQELEGLKLRADITPIQLEALNAELDSLKSKVKELEGRGELTPDEIKGLQDQLRVAQNRIVELEEQNKQIPKLQGELSKIRESLASAQEKIKGLEGAGGASSSALAKVQAALESSQGEVRTLQERIRELEQRPDINSSKFEEYKAAKLRLNNLDAILANLTPDRLRELLKKESECESIRKRLKSYTDTEVSPEQIAELKAQLNAKDTEIIDLKRQLGIANETIKEFETIKLELVNYKKLFTNLNELLKKKGFDPLPVPTADTFDTIQGRLDSYIQKPSSMGENTNLCMVSMIYSLMRNVYSTRGTPMSTDAGRYAKLFRKIDTYLNQPISVDLLDLFFLSLAAWKNKGAPATARPITITTVDKFEDYTQKFTKFKGLVNLFDAKDRDAASYILRELIPKNSDFTRYILDTNAQIKLSTGLTQGDTTDMGLLFLIFLTYVNKILQEKRPELEAAGCPILE
jgi:chromosome segregation ATPase